MTGPSDSPTDRTLPAPSTDGRFREDPEGSPAMTLLESELASSRLRELRAEAEVAARARRLYVARKAARRAERAARRAARANAAVS